MNKYQLAMTVLDRALTTRRPHGAESTAKFCQWLRKLLPASKIDKCGNIHVDNRYGASRTLFVAHVDTVHRTGGKNKVIKTDKQWSANGAPLGADDGAGVAILAHMLAHGVPGYYIFTQGEEVGGVGAKYLADHESDLLKQFDRAIAFDRRMTYSVITHQGFGGRCASDEFADALSGAFNDRGMLFMPDDTGVYTDTAEFVEFIPECTNISAGYDMEHSERETLDMDHFRDMLKVVLKVQWDALPTKRDVTVRDDPWGKWYSDTLGDWAAGDKDFMDALDQAFDGRKAPLVKMIAKVAEPEFPNIAEKHINRRKMDERFLCRLYDDAQFTELDDLMLDAYDEIGVFA